MAAAPICAHAESVRGEFQSGGKAVAHWHCAPPGAGPYPAVILLHGAGYSILASEDFEAMCAKLADQGYYADYLEYYSRTNPGTPRLKPDIATQFPIWLEEIHDLIASMRKNPAVDSERIALMGFSMGAYLALTYAAQHPDDVSAVVDYYGGLPRAFDKDVSEMPPVLILHGDADTMVPISEARALDAALARAARPHQMHIYPGTPHGFNFESTPVYDKTDAEDAWRSSLKFLDDYVKYRRD
jgi:carboxymethylenebutenolidase